MNRHPPAYMRYAADSQVAPQYRFPLPVHGCLALCRDAIWIDPDDRIPADPAELALLIRQPVQEVAGTLPVLLAAGLLDSPAPGFLSDPQLRAYKAKVRQLSAVRALAGQLGNDVKKGKGRKKARGARASANAKASPVANATADARPSADASLTPTSTPTSLVGAAKLSLVREGGTPDTTFVAGYESAQHTFPNQGGSA